MSSCFVDQPRSHAYVFKIGLPVLMFYGGRSIYHSSMLDALENFKSDHFAHVEIFADGDFVQEESPAKVAESFRLFCRGFHIMI